LEAVSVGGNDVEFATVGLEEHLRGHAGELEIGDEDGALEVYDREAILRAAENEGEGGVGEDGNFVGLRDDGDGVEKLESALVVDGEHCGATVDDENIFGVGSETGLDGLGIGVGAAVDLTGGGINGDELVGAGGRSVDAVAVGGEIERVRRRADGDARDLVGGGIEDEDVAASVADAPDFVAFRVLAEVGDGGAGLRGLGDGEFGDGLELGEINDGERAVVGGDVGVHVEIGAEEGGAMLAEKDDDRGNEEEKRDEVDAEVFGARHGLGEG